MEETLAPLIGSQLYEMAIHLIATEVTRLGQAGLTTQLALAEAESESESGGDSDNSDDVDLLGLIALTKVCKCLLLLFSSI